MEGSKLNTLETGPYGVVQGGRSSGELFLYFLNDLPLQLAKKTDPKDTCDSTGKEFVDDVNILTKATTIPKLLKQVELDYNKLHQYLVNHKMCINSSKTQFMILMPPKNTEDLTITIDNNKINHQDSIKVLGVTLSANMKFDCHIWQGKESMLRSLNRKTALLRTIKPYISTAQLSNVGASLINSTILYAAPLWGATTKSNIQKVQSNQIKAARIIKNESWKRTKKKKHRQELLDELNWPNTQQIINAATNNLTKRAISAKSSAGLNDLFKKTTALHARKHQIIRIQHKGKATCTTNIFSTNAPQLFNSLPAGLKHPQLTTNQFKTKLKNITLAGNRLQAH